MYHGYPFFRTNPSHSQAPMSRNILMGFPPRSIKDLKYRATQRYRYSIDNISDCCYGMEHKTRRERDLSAPLASSNIGRRPATHPAQHLREHTLTVQYSSLHQEQLGKCDPGYLPSPVIMSLGSNGYSYSEPSIGASKHTVLSQSLPVL